MNGRLTIALLMLLGASPALGEEFFRGVVTDVKRNNAWPQPFTQWDRPAARAPFEVMIENGWRKQNLLADHHFENNGLQLTETGRKRVEWILTEAPEQHRVIYVRRAESQDKTVARVATVEQFVSGRVGPGDKVTILETNVAPAGWPADRVDAIGRKFNASLPEPRLGKAGAGGGDSSSGK